MWRDLKINYDVMHELELSFFEYALLDYVYKTQTHPIHNINGWCDKKNSSIARFLRVRRETVSRTSTKLERRGLMEKKKNGQKRTTPKWFNKTYELKTKINEGVTLSHRKCDKKSQQGVIKSHTSNFKCDKKSQQGVTFDHNTIISNYPLIEDIYIPKNEKGNSNKNTSKNKNKLLHIEAAEKMIEFLKNNPDQKEAILNLARWKGTEKSLEADINNHFSHPNYSTPFNLKKAINNPADYMATVQHWLRMAAERKGPNKKQASKSISDKYDRYIQQQNEK